MSTRIIKIVSIKWIYLLAAGLYSSGSKKIQVDSMGATFPYVMIKSCSLQHTKTCASLELIKVRSEDAIFHLILNQLQISLLNLLGLFLNHTNWPLKIKDVIFTHRLRAISYMYKQTTSFQFTGLVMALNRISEAICSFNYMCKSCYFNC